MTGRLTGRISLLATAIFLTASLPLAAAKTDVVVFLNGDRLTGEVKKLERGKLFYSTDGAGTIQVEWDDIASVESRQTLEVELETGERLWGSLAAADQGRLTVVTEEGPRSFDLPSVVFLTPIERGFWKRLDGSLDLGFSFTEADDRRQFSFGADASYRSPRLWRTLSYTTVQTSQPETSEIDRQQLSFELVRALPRLRRVWVAYTSLQRNSQLGIDLRALLGAGAGWFVIQNNSERLMLLAGATFNHEELTTEEENLESIEAFLGLGFQSFRYDTPKRNIDIRLRVFPSLSESDRVRAELDASVSWEIVSDFFFGLTLLESYDNQPSGERAEETDLSLISSLGWSF